MILVDTYNVLHVAGVLPPDLAGMEAPDLARALARGRYASSRITLVCDGVRPGAGHIGPAATRIGDIRILYTGAGRTADDEIESLIQRSTAPARMTVVSTDRRIRRAARKRRARSLKSEDFLRQLVDDLGRRADDPLPPWVHEVPLSTPAINHWLEAFGLTPGDPLLTLASAEPPPPPPPTSPQTQGATGAPNPDEAPVFQPEAQPPHTPPPAIDPPLAELLKELGEPINPEDLDMRRWLSDTDSQPPGGAEPDSPKPRP